jgi:type I restriction enzyme S subunit
MNEDMNLDDFVYSDISSDGEDFIETAAGKIPGDWSTTKVEEVCELRNGKATDHVEIGVEAYPVYGSNGPIGSHSEPNFDRGLIFGRVGAVGEVERVTEPVWVSDNAIQARATGEINTEYLYYNLIDQELGALATKTAQPLLNQSTIGNVTVPTPSLEEQRKIASILYTVDQAIQKTRQIIKQLQTVRRGTEQDVLSRGVREDGTLRAADEIEYRSSWVGEIPQDWEVKQYRELISDSSVGIVVKPSQYYDDSGTVPILRSKDISADGIVDGDFEYMTEESNAKNENSQLREGDVITVRSGDPGLSCVVSSEFDGANCADLLISTPGPDLDSHYAAMWINSFAGRKQIDRFQAGLAQKHFNLGALRKLRVGVPSLDEQKRIVERVSSLSESIERERECKRQLQRLKQGLMQDLLSGEIRTADRDINIHPEVKKHG